MPNVLLPVPQCEQSRDGSCLPACVQMVLSYLGDERSESDLAQMLGTKEYGTPIGNAERLHQEGYDVQVQGLNRQDLIESLDGNIPVIARVWTMMLAYWQVATSHVVVVVGYDDRFVYLNDPSFSSAPKRVLWDAFLAAWAEYDETAVIITKT